MRLTVRRARGPKRSGNNRSPAGQVKSLNVSSTVSRFQQPWPSPCREVLLVRTIVLRATANMGSSYVLKTS